MLPYSFLFSFFFSSKLVAEFVHENFTMSECSDESSDEDYVDISTETDSEISLPSSSSSSEDDEDEIPLQRYVGTREGADSVSLPSSTSSSSSEDDEDILQRHARTKGAATSRSKEDPTKGWSSDTFHPKTLTFTGTSGVLVDISNDATPLQIFSLLVPDSILGEVVFQTNLYADQVIAAAKLKNKSRINNWTEMTLEELKNFIALTVFMGLDEKPAIEDYWAQSGIFHNYVFPSVMSRNRFQLIRRFLHFADNRQWNPNDENRDRLYKVRKFIDTLIANFQSTYWPSRNVAIDEQLLLHKGKLLFRQYIPIKRSRFGIKIYSLCDETGYVWNSEVYTGKDTTETFIPGLEGKTANLVVRLMKNLLGKGHNLYVDNFYSSEQLFKYLLGKKTGACGTVRKNRVKLPADFKKKKLDKGQTASISKDNLLAMRLNDKKEVMFISTIHPNNKLVASNDKTSGTTTMKDVLIVDYNHNMGFVDKNDQMLASHTCVRKCTKWTTKVAFHFIEEAIFNSFILFKMHNKRSTFKKFKINLCNSFITEVLPTPSINEFPRTMKQHYLIPIPPTKKKTNPTRKCIVCTKHKKRKESRYQCGDCHNRPALCVHPCFIDYHTLDEY